ncbi:hypothetical protein BV898_17254 [Hypsibius exemplaris]|uniref:Uncharacterized protein n=1 Tax=Hypsibius exemplaris TaxID=2072580 RepID=A0A9X6NLX9_HYPEX|nr:hypothetical protein BV898_17254 [Hypsibius exemplaris]
MDIYIPKSVNSLLSGWTFRLAIDQRTRPTAVEDIRRSDLCNGQTFNCSGRRSVSWVGSTSKPSTAAADGPSPGSDQRADPQLQQRTVRLLGRTNEQTLNCSGRRSVSWFGSTNKPSTAAADRPSPGSDQRADPQLQRQTVRLLGQTNEQTLNCSSGRSVSWVGLTGRPSTAAADGPSPGSDVRGGQSVLREPLIGTVDSPIDCWAEGYLIRAVNEPSQRTVQRTSQRTVSTNRLNEPSQRTVSTNRLNNEPSQRTVSTTNPLNEPSQRTVSTAVQPSIWPDLLSVQSTVRSNVRLMSELVCGTICTGPIRYSQGKPVH